MHCLENSKGIESFRNITSSSYDFDDGVISVESSGGTGSPGNHPNYLLRRVIGILRSYKLGVKLLINMLQ
jgi:hypothetical protein